MTALYYQAENQKKLTRFYELRFKKQLPKQAKKEIALNKRNSSSWNWEEEIWNCVVGILVKMEYVY